MREGTEGTGGRGKGKGRGGEGEERKEELLGISGKMGSGFKEGLDYLVVVGISFVFLYLSNQITIRT